MKTAKTIERNNSFILTMWYVNVISNAEELPLFAGFILTMWYVNWDSCFFSGKTIHVLY